MIEDPTPYQARDLIITENGREFYRCNTPEEVPNVLVALRIAYRTGYDARQRQVMQILDEAFPPKKATGTIGGAA